MFIDFKNNDFSTKGENITITNKNLGTTSTMPKARLNRHVNGALGATFLGAAAYGFMIGAVYGSKAKSIYQYTLKKPMKKNGNSRRKRRSHKGRPGNWTFSRIFRR
jgi:hypothetical protein